MLPGHLTERPATPSDAEALYALVAAHNESVVGHADYTLDDARDELVEPGFDLATDSWLVHDADTLVGWGWAFRKGDGEQVDIDVIAADRAVADHLFARAITRAGEMAAGHTRHAIDIGVYRADTAQRALAESHGFTAATSFHRMRIDHTAAPLPSQVPGLTLTHGPGDESLRRTAHRINTESFKDHFGFAPKPFEEWAERLDKASTFDWSQLTVASLDGDPCAVLIQNDQYVEDEDCGYVATIGVLPETRGRGIARHLLLHAFTRDHTTGRTGTLLHVDTNNTTPALGLYQSVGMRQVLVIDAWRRVVETTG
jgi:mycothiol synthase